MFEFFHKFKATKALKRNRKQRERGNNKSFAQTQNALGGVEIKANVEPLQQ